MCGCRKPIIEQPTAPPAEPAAEATPQPERQPVTASR